MTPNLAVTDPAFLGVAGASGGASWSTAYENSILGGGTDPLWTAHNYAMKFVSGTWSNITALPADRQLLQGGGNHDDGIMIAGDSSGTSNPEDDVYGWNGSVWSSLALISMGSMMLGGGGNMTDAIWMGGTYAYTDTCQTFNGSVWATKNSLVNGTRGAVGSGKSDGAWCMGGYTTGATNQTWNQQFDGINWALSVATPTTEFYSYNGGSGLPTSAIVSQQGTTGGCYMFDGSAFSQTSATNYIRKYRMVSGDNTNALKNGGSDNGNSLTTEYYDSSTWQTSGSMTIATFGCGQGGNTV